MDTAVATTSRAILTDEDYVDLNISVLRLPTRERLSCMLNAYKVIPSPENLPRDWRGLCTLFNYTIPSGCSPTDPIGKIFKFCEAKITLAHFIQCLERLDRYDVIEDTKELMISDIISFKEHQCSVRVNPAPILHTDSEIDIITLDDIHAVNNGSPLPRYDAFLLYDNADMQSANAVVEKLEINYKLKLCLKDRDLRPGVMFEYQSIIRLISERCNWLITIVSNDFLKSPWNRFIVNYTQSLAIEQKIPKIIPCLFDDCVLPQELKCYVHLYFNKPNPFCDPWYKLRMSITSNFNRTLTDNSYGQDKSIEDEIKIDLKMKSSVMAIAEKNEPVKITSEEHNLKPKKKNVVRRIIKNVGSFSEKFIKNKSNKPKVPCSSF